MNRTTSTATSTPSATKDIAAAGAPASARTVARIDYDDAQGPLLQTSVSGTLEPITAQALRRALLGYPLMTLAVVWRIHWQALRLFAKRVRFFRLPAPPPTSVSR